MAHLRKTPNGRHEARYRAPDGTERAKRFATKRDAQAFLERQGVARQTGRWRDPRSGRMLLSEWVAIWQPTTVNLRPSSRARDDSYLRNHVLPSFGGVRLNAIGRLDVAAWVTELGGKGLAPATVRKAYQTLSKAMRAAVDADLIADTPCRNIDLPELQIEEMRFLAPEDIDALAEIIHPRYRAMVLFDAYCGLRFSELAGLRRSAVNIQRGKVRVVHNAVEVRGTIEWGAPKTRAGRRTVPMTPVITATLAQHLETYVEDHPEALVFPTPDGTVLRAGNWRSRFWTPATRKAGLAGVRPHDLRHTAVSLWIAAGANPKQIAAWAGHTSTSIVLDRYGHLYDGNEADVLARLDTFLTKPDADAASPWIPRVLRGNGKPPTPSGPGTANETAAG